MNAYEVWMSRVDAACEKIAGVSIHDLPDCCYADWHEEGLTPAQAARRAIRQMTHDDGY